MSPGFVLNWSAGLSGQDGTFQVRQGPDYHGIKSRILSVCIPSLGLLLGSLCTLPKFLLPKNYLVYKYLCRWVELCRRISPHICTCVLCAVMSNCMDQHPTVLPVCCCQSASPWTLLLYPAVPLNRLWELGMELLDGAGP